MKLEIKHLAPYFPHNLKFGNEFIYGCDFVLGGLTKEFIISIDDRKLAINVTNYKPLLRPLSDLTKEIEIDGKKFVPMEYFFEFENPHNKIPKRMKYYYEEAPNRVSITHNASSRSTEVLFSEMGANPYWMMQKLFEWHFDVFGLIDKDLARPLI